MTSHWSMKLMIAIDEQSLKGDQGGNEQGLGVGQ